MRADPPFEDPGVAAVFASFPTASQTGLLGLRSLIFETAATTPGVGRIHEALRWGQPAYLTPETRSGSTIRLGLHRAGGFAVFTHCRTTILPDFQSVFPQRFTYDGTRAVCFREGDGLPLEELRLLIAAALTYHLKRRP